jgi:mannose/fructose/N-acetylgalactosamine-specific phosphotransferase system component IIB
MVQISKSSSSQEKQLIEQKIRTFESESVQKIQLEQMIIEPTPIDPKSTISNIQIQSPKSVYEANESIAQLQVQLGKVQSHEKQEQIEKKIQILAKEKQDIQEK